MAHLIFEGSSIFFSIDDLPRELVLIALSPQQVFMFDCLDQSSLGFLFNELQKVDERKMSEVFPDSDKNLKL